MFAMIAKQVIISSARIHHQITGECFSITLPNVLIFFINGGRGEIRTHGPRKETSVFKTDAFNHSATLPFLYLLMAEGLGFEPRY